MQNKINTLDELVESKQALGTLTSKVDSNSTYQQWLNNYFPTVHATKKIRLMSFLYPAKVAYTQDSLQN